MLQEIQFRIISQCFIIISICLCADKLNAQTTNFDWVKQLGGNSDEEAYSVVVDVIGNVYTTGHFTGTTDFDPDSTGVYNLTSNGSYDIFISKLDSAGNFLWAKAVGGTSTDRGEALTVDQSSNVYVTGFFSDTVDFDPGAAVANHFAFSNFGMFILKLDAAGNFIWVKQMGGGIPGAAEGNSIVLDGNNNIYTTGFFIASVDFDPGADSTILNSNGNQDIFILKLDAAGNFNWVKQVGGAAEDNAYSIANHSGDIYVTGKFMGSLVDFNVGSGVDYLTATGTADIFLLKLDTAGIYSWAKHIGSTSVNTGFGVAVDGFGNAVITGNFYGTTDFDPGISAFDMTADAGGEPFVAKYDQAGSFLWAKQMTGSVYYSAGKNIFVDLHNDIYTIGFFQGTVDFDPGVGVADLTSAGSLTIDIYISKLDDAGNFRYAKQLGGTSWDYGNSIAIDNWGNVYSVGSFQDVVDFNQESGIFMVGPAVGSDIYIHKMSQDGFTGVVNAETDFENRFYPNPTDGKLSISIGNQPFRFCFYNTLGKQVLNGNSSNSNIAVDLAELPSGIYFLTINSKSKSFSTKIIKE